MTPSTPLTSRAPLAPVTGLRRSVDLFRAFRVEQSDPEHFYGLLARDSVALVREHEALEDRLVLDIGGGPGYFADAFRAAGAAYFSLDADSAELSARAAPGPGAVVGDALALPFATGAVDICFSSNVVEHVRDPWRMCDELVRVTKPGGLVVIGFTNWLSPWGGHETSPWHYLGGRRAAARYERRHGQPPKNCFGESLFAVSVRDALRWAKECRDAELVEARPRYYPRAARSVLRVPVLRELVTWNLLMVLRRSRA